MDNKDKQVVLILSNYGFREENFAEEIKQKKMKIIKHQNQEFEFSSDLQSLLHPRPLTARASSQTKSKATLKRKRSVSYDKSVVKILKGAIKNLELEKDKSKTWKRARTIDTVSNVKTTYVKAKVNQVQITNRKFDQSKEQILTALKKFIRSPYRKAEILQPKFH